MRPRFILPLILLLVATSAIHIDAHPFAQPSSKASPDLSLFAYTAAKSYDPLAWMHGGDRFSPDAAVFLRDSNGIHRLIPNFAASADSAISFDAERMLFAGKAHAHDPWQIWEIALPAGDPHRITSGSEDCVRPLYLPDDRVVYARKTGGRYIIEVMNLAGGKPLALTYGPANFFPTDNLRDGRILFEAGYPLGTDSTPEIYTVYSDGSGVESYRCDHGKARHSGRQTSSGDIVFAAAQGLARFTSPLAHEVSISAPAGEYAGDVAESASGDWIFAWRSNPNALFRLMRSAPGAKELEPLVADEAANLVEAVLIGPHRVPNRHPSGLHDWPNANLLCLNAYTSKYEFVPGSIRSARLYTRDSAGNTTLLGTAPVERDGSLFVQIPSERAIQIELLDSSGKTLKRESGFFWMRRGEQRSCVGCHAGPETAPENAVPMTLLKSTTPADMTGAAQSAAGGH